MLSFLRTMFYTFSSPSTTEWCLFLSLSDSKLVCASWLFQSYLNPAIESAFTYGQTDIKRVVRFRRFNGSWHKMKQHFRCFQGNSPNQSYSSVSYTATHQKDALNQATNFIFESSKSQYLDVDDYQKALVMMLSHKIQELVLRLFLLVKQ